jgi:hypothetical protein
VFLTTKQYPNNVMEADILNQTALFSPLKAMSLKCTHRSFSNNAHVKHPIQGGTRLMPYISLGLVGADAVEEHVQGAGQKPSLSW